MENKEIDEKDLEKILYCYWGDMYEKHYPRTYFDDKTILYEDNMFFVAMVPKGDKDMWYPNPIVYRKKSLKNILS